MKQAARVIEKYRDGLEEIRQIFEAAADTHCQRSRYREMRDYRFRHTIRGIENATERLDISLKWIGKYEEEKRSIAEFHARLPARGKSREKSHC